MLLPASLVAGSTTATVLLSVSTSSTFVPSWTTSTVLPVAGTTVFRLSISVLARPIDFLASLATQTAASPRFMRCAL